MAFEFNLDKVKESLLNAGKEVEGMAKGASAVAKIKIDIRNKETFLEKQYALLGKAIYAAHKDDETLEERVYFPSIQEAEAEWRNRKAQRGGKITAQEPLYTMEDAEGAIRHIVPCAYNKMVEVCKGIQIRFTDIGHLLGSSSIEVWAEERGVTKKLVFSGDIGNINQPLIKDPAYTEEADYVIMESTYGDRLHSLERPDYVKELAAIIQETFERGGNVVIPSFAVGRTQEMLYFLRQIKQDRLIQGFENFEVYVDSPLAVEATGIFHNNTYTCFDEEAMELVNKGINPIAFPGLRLSITSDESKAINFDMNPKVILSASGMCEAGRIRHHLKHNLWSDANTVLFVGYQAEGSLGRKLQGGARYVRLFGEDISVNAEIASLHGTSGHADQSGLLRWLAGFREKPQMVFVNHGDDTSCTAFQRLLITINYPSDLKKLPEETLPQVCDEVRDFIIQQLSKNPGHLGSSLGTVELTVALHYVF